MSNAVLRKNVLMLKPEVAEKLEERHEQYIANATRYEPMVVPPTPLGYGMTDSYGFRTSNAPLNLVKTRDQKLLSEMRDNIRPEYAYFMEGINGIGNSRFRINKWMLMIMDRLLSGGEKIAKLPDFNMEKEPEMLTEFTRKRASVILARKSPAVKMNEFLESLPHKDAVLVKTYTNEVKAKREYIQRKTELAGARINLRRSMALAEKYKDFERIHFPVNVDRRSRVYYATPNLNPQGPDHEKALIELAYPERVGMKGLYWLAINVSNLMGFDKADLGDRVRYVKKHWAKIVSWVENPAINRGWETETDKPFQFLAAAKDLMDAMALDNPYDHESRVSVACDASCSGLQILGSLTKCVTSLFNTNCLPAVRDENGKLVMQDIYGLAAKASTKTLMADLEGEDEDKAKLAKLVLSWGYAVKDGKLTRNILKRNTMTYFYGSKASGMGQQIMDDHIKPELAKAIEKVGRDGDVTKAGFPFPTKELQVAVSQYLAKVNFAAIEAIAPIPSLVMKSLQQYGKLISKGGKKMRWTTPLGFIVEQHYEIQEDLVIDSLLTGQKRKQTTTRRNTGEVNQNKQKLGAAPNFVHSLDASLLLKAVALGVQMGIKDWRVVHDSFAVSAAKTASMVRLLKRTMCEMFKGDILAKIGEELDAQVPENLKAEIIPFPSYGDADLELIKKAELPFC
jgi:DNA-directed RNA polymerase